MMKENTLLWSLSVLIFVCHLLLAACSPLPALLEELDEDGQPIPLPEQRPSTMASSKTHQFHVSTSAMQEWKSKVDNHPDNPIVKAVKSEFYGHQKDAVAARSSDYSTIARAGVRGGKRKYEQFKQAYNYEEYAQAAKHGALTIAKPVIGACYEAGCRVKDAVEHVHAHLKSVRPQLDRNTLTEHLKAWDTKPKANQETVESRRKVRKWLADSPSPEREAPKPTQRSGERARQESAFRDDRRRQYAKYAARASRGGWYRSPSSSPESNSAYKRAWEAQRRY